MGDLNTAPAEASAPDPDRAGPDSPAPIPEWLAYLIALVIVFLLEQLQAARWRRARRSASRRVGRHAPPRDSAQPPGAAIRAPSDHATARTRRDRGVALECADLSRTRAELLEKLRQSDIDPAVLSQLEALGIASGPTGPDTAASTEPVRAARCAAEYRGAPRRLASADPQHAVSPVPWRPMSARAGTGPPTGPPAVSRRQSCYA